MHNMLLDPDAVSVRQSTCSLELDDRKDVKYKDWLYPGTETDAM
jgi:hypothetical protein